MDSTSSSPSTQRDAIIIKLKEEIHELTKANENDDFFDLTVEELASLQKQLAKEANHEGMLILNDYRRKMAENVAEKNQQLKMHSWKQSVIRFRILDKYIIQVKFYSTESVSQLFEFIDGNFSIVNGYQLWLINKQLERSDTTNLIQAGIAPRSVITLSFPEDTASNADNLISAVEKSSLRMGSMQEADQLSTAWTSGNTLFQPVDPEQVQQQIMESNRQNMETSPMTNLQYQQRKPPPALPKWFKHQSK